MFEIEARLLARGAVGALAAGFVNAAGLLVVARAASGPLISWWNLTSLTLGTAVFGLLFAPLTMLVLPLTWLTFRQSHYRPVALLGIGLLGGVVWSIELLSDDLSPYPLVAIGALSGVSAASCFLGLPASTPPAQSEQASRAAKTDPPPPSV